MRRRQFVHIPSPRQSVSLIPEPQSRGDQETGYRKSPHVAIIVNQPLCLRRLVRTLPRALAPLDYIHRLNVAEYAYSRAEHTSMEKPANIMKSIAIYGTDVFTVIPALFYLRIYVHDRLRTDDVTFSRCRSIYYDIEFRVRTS